jgi:hypothetical protein
MRLLRRRDLLSTSEFRFEPGILDSGSVAAGFGRDASRGLIAG